MAEEVNSITLNNYVFRNSPKRDYITSVNLYNTPWLYNSMGGDFYNGGAFGHCANLLSVTGINNNVINMYQTFRECRNLIYVESLPQNIQNLDWTFCLCESLVNSPVIPNNVVSMDNTFIGCHNLSNVPELPNNVIDMYQTFIGCHNLTNAPVIPNSVTNMAGTFIECYNLINAPVISNGVTNMYQTFESCYNLINAPVIPNSVIDMDITFSDCYNLVNVTEIPDSVTNMGGTFAFCSNLITAPNIPSSVRGSLVYWGWEGLFQGCTNLTGNVYIESENITIATNCFADTSLNKDVYIPFELSYEASDTKYCWKNNDLTIYVDNDFYSQAYGSVSQVVYSDDIYDENLNIFDGILFWAPSAQAFAIQYYSEQAGGWVSYIINYDPNDNIVTIKHIGDSSFTYDSFISAGYGTDPNNRINGVCLFDINSLPQDVDLTDYDYNIDANNDVLLTNYKGIGKTNIVTPHLR